MCQKIQKLWQCGHSVTEDPRRCCYAASNKRRTHCQEFGMGADRASCPDYGFIWAFRDPVVEKWEGDCSACRRERRERVREEANKKFIEQSQAYPHLRNLSAHDDDTRQKSGRPRFDRTNSEICIPPGWTSAMNRLPGNANEFEQYNSGPRLLYNGPRPIPPILGPNTEPPQRQPQTQFQPEQHAFTQQINTRDQQPVPQGYRSRAPPPGYAPQMPQTAADIRQFAIARHERDRLTPPNSSEDLTRAGAAISSDSDDLNIHDGRPHYMQDRRRPSFAKTHGSLSKGWVPPITLPLPPKQETDIQQFSFASKLDLDCSR